MNRSEKRISQRWWPTLGSSAIAVAVAAVIGFSTVTPAMANWGVSVGVGAPAYSYYAYPAYPTYGYSYSPYYGGYYSSYPAYYYGPSYYGPSVSFGVYGR